MLLAGLFKWRKPIIALGIALAIPIGIWLVGATWRVARFDASYISDSALLFDTNGKLITSVGNKRQAFVPFEEIPASLRNAIVAIEDSRFYHHFGVDIRGILRSLWVDIKAGSRVQGASTITQQLARNLFLNRQKTLARKLQEAAYAILLELRYSKPQILALYLNTIYFGEGAYGIEAASFTYFGKSTSQLDLAESALLAGIPKAPSSLSPYSNPAKIIARRRLVLSRMAELGYISQQTANSANQQELKLARLRGGQAPYFVDYVAAQLTDRFGANLVYRGGLRVTTTLNIDMQSAARAAMGEVQGAIVALDPRTGGIRAMVGGRDYAESQFNRATQALRQPGSAFKPFVYATALEKGWPMNAVLIDEPVNINGYTPQNFKDEYWRQVTMKQAITRSLNTATVRLLQAVGVDSAINMAQRLGINTLVLPDDRNLAMALGGLTRGVTPLNMAEAYSPFANKGISNAAYAIEQVMDRSGKVLYRHKARPKRVISEEVAYLMTDMLQSAVKGGTGSAANIGRPQAGKTGTTNDAVSAWFVGYTPQLVAAVYAGNDTRKPLLGGGGSIAAPIWGKFASKALRDIPVEGFPVPGNIQTNIPVDVFTGLLAGPSCQITELDAFVVGSMVPVNVAPCYWNPNAQPKPYRLSPNQAGITQNLAILPFGDDPALATPPGGTPTSYVIPPDVLFRSQPGAPVTAMPSALLPATPGIPTVGQTQSPTNPTPPATGSTLGTDNQLLENAPEAELSGTEQTPEPTLSKTTPIAPVLPESNPTSTNKKPQDKAESVPAPAIPEPAANKPKPVTAKPSTTKAKG